MNEVVRSVVLPLEPAAAFALFTNRAADWWPPDRKHTGADAAVFIQPTRFWERAGDGREVELGAVRAWQPPRQLVLDFYPGTDADHPTRVTIRFDPESSGTRVTVVHRPTATSLDLWQARAPLYATSWDLCLEGLAHLAAT
jgi:hypothetical protein